jgi:membrane protease YdiL (CAAX protease family)
MSAGPLFSILFDICLISLPILFLFFSGKKNLKGAVQELGFVRIRALPLAGKTALLFIAMIAVSVLLSLALSFFGLNDLGLVTESIWQAGIVLPVFLGMIALRVISEEIFFRGFLVEKIGIVASSGVFALFHIGYGSAAEIIGAFALGLVLAKAFQLNKNLYPNILAHAAYNAVAIMMILGV